MNKALIYLPFAVWIFGMLFVCLWVRALYQEQAKWQELNPGLQPRKSVPKRMKHSVQRLLWRIRIFISLVCAGSPIFYSWRKSKL